ncbi:SDR family oxidoreductase [Salinicoccus halodurans]|uniref:Short-chain dehydrogenase n=1 Tax=Salinicoccus halodurans TaxID=407035 RepID=A0A0F7HKW4_9STAP|nr:SDR family oxidoreductase [Salinicoccus halodurans]AKG74608.1 short-chain dehydrogenase [Salinicoccus halodurans]SFK89264.1 Short-chain dehydrogenase [Salinicoccus halodurans]
MGKTIMITGAGTGLGKGAAIGLAKEGHKVIASVEKDFQIGELREAVQEAGTDLEIFKMDITNSEDRESMKKYSYDIFVANAAINEGGPIWEMPMENIRRLFEINVFGTLETARIAAEHFVSKREGKIIFISSKAEKMSSAYKGLYSSSKHALGAIAKAMKGEMEEFNVQVATINPGRFGTGFNDRAVEANWKWFDENKHHTSLDKLKASGDSLNHQLNPQMMIDKMVEIIPMDHHKFREVYPEDTAEDMREEEKKDWDMEI